MVVNIAFGVIGGYLNVTGQGPVSDWPVPLWGWLTIALVGLIVGPFFAFHKKHKQIRQLVGTHPALTVIDLIDPDDRDGTDAGYLRIENDGESCQIHATGEIIGGALGDKRLHNVWPIPWRNEPELTVPLEKGGALVLGLQAQMVRYPNVSGVEPEYEYLLKFEHYSGNSLIHAAIGWSPTQDSPKCVIRVRITSTPSIVGRVLPRDYEVSLGEGGELIWRPVPV